MTSPALVWAPSRTTIAHPPRRPVLPLVAGDRGPDVASYQGQPNWDLIAASRYRFAFTKATEGTDYANPTFDYNWTEIERVGMVRGAYHFARPDASSPEAECDWFLSHVHFKHAHDLAVLDLEDGRGNLLDWCLRWMRRCYQISGRKPLLYSGPYFMQQHNLNVAGLAEAAGGLWLAAYISHKPAVPPGWDEIMFWQFTDKEVLPGIVGGVDCNIYLP